MSGKFTLTSFLFMIKIYHSFRLSSAPESEKHKVNTNRVLSYQYTHISMEMDFNTGVFDNPSNKDLETSRSQKPGEK